MIVLRKRQRGFLLNPYRFSGTTIGRNFSIAGESGVAFGGAAIASAAATSAGEASVLADSQTTKGAASMVGEATMTMVGASIVRGAASMLAESGAEFAVGGTTHTCDAADFDGANDYLTKTALTGQTSSKKGILACWWRLDSIDASGNYILDSTDTGPESSVVTVFIDADGRVNVQGYSTTSLILGMLSTTTYGTGTWRHLLASWDLGAAATHLYISDADAKNTTTATDANVNYSGADEWDIGTINLAFNPAIPIDGGLAEFYFAPGQYLDFSVEENRRKFITSAGKPANLGTTGSTPTGTQPIVYLGLADGETANNFAVNKGTGGNFTVNGSLTTYASSPSD